MTEDDFKLCRRDGSGRAIVGIGNLTYAVAHS